MSELLSISRGRVRRPDFFLLYGVDGIGKTTMCAQLPDVVFVGPERGSEQMDVARFPVSESYAQLMTQLLEIANKDHAFKSLALDSLDHIERLIWDHIIKREGVVSIEDVGGGFGKGYTHALKEWDRFFSLLDSIRNKKNMNIGIIAHSQVKTFTDPQTGTAYDRYQLKMNDKASALCREKVDSVLFANFKVFTKGKEGQKHVAFGDGKRVMYTERRPAFDAKNRFGLPFELPLSYVEYKTAVDTDPASKIKKITLEIETHRVKLEESLQSKVSESVKIANGNFEMLVAIRDRVISRLNNLGEKHE